MKAFFAALLMTVILVVGARAMKADEVSSFFLKAPKSVPRAGRSAPGGYDGFFLKASKSVPRVGRRDGSGATLTNYYWPSDKYPFIQPQGPNDIWDNNENNIQDSYYFDYYPNTVDDDNLSHRSRRYNVDAVNLGMINPTKEREESNF